ncbi:unnamed protein product, partial [marine sediment metagenome]
MFYSADNIILRFPAKVSKVSTVTGYPYHQGGIFLRVLLGVSQGCGINHINLDMPPSPVKEGFHQRNEILQPPFVSQNGGAKLDIQHSTIQVPGMVKLGNRF